MEIKDDYPPTDGILSLYGNLKGMKENMPVIRKLLGLSEYGAIPTDTFIGRAVQRFIENDSKDVVCETGVNQLTVIE